MKIRGGLEGTYADLSEVTLGKGCDEIGELAGVEACGYVVLAGDGVDTEEKVVADGSWEVS